MAIDLKKTFGAATGMKVANTSEEREVAEFWLNVGYETDDPTYPFVSLPMGIALDTQKPLEVRGRNEDFNAFTGARNDLLEQLTQAAAALEPGQDMIVGLEGGLAIQIRRRNEAPTAPAVSDNKFARKFAFTDPKQLADA